ncbi:MAG: DUF4446 family protein [Lachnospiraceae bacterium]|nr:DUF4446 family protein [Candidatus Equihabitans merdae]
MSNIFADMGIDAGFILILLMIIAIVLIVMMMAMKNEMKRMQKQYKQFMRGMDGVSLEKNFRSKFAFIDKLSEAQEVQNTENKIIHMVQDKSLTKYGIAKYDAFDDVGGKMSFALAMLDKSNTGFVLNAIHSKGNCFLYLKEVVNGESYIMLSDEEIQALRNAQKYGNEEEIIANYLREKMPE